MSLFQPSGQIRMTNVAVVRLKKKGKRFEIACYKNKVIGWRNGAETDIDEVVQSLNVFLNVSKGVLASDRDLEQAFSSTDRPAICRIGDLQVSDRERSLQQSTMSSQIASLVAQRSVSSDTKMPVSISVVESLMKDAHFSVNPSQSAKKQALELFQLFKQLNYPIERARMRVRVSVPEQIVKPFKTALPADCDVENQLFGPTSLLTVTIPPGELKNLQTIVSDLTRGRGSVEVIDLAAFDESEDLQD
ncbi:hypothetical protein RCL1_004334 [Eukaryota sp. TZLM3-RCL]